MDFAMIEQLNMVYFSHREEWRAWLQANFETTKEIWFVFPKKNSGLPAVSYNDAVEEALCFGWIDSTIRSLDEDRKIQRFTPRRPKSTYSQPNIERLNWLWEQNLIHPKVAEKVAVMVQTPFVFPEDLIATLQQEPEVWKHFQQFSEGYKRIRLAYIEDAKIRPEEYQKRLEHFISKTKVGKQIPGYGGIEKYYAR